MTLQSNTWYWRIWRRIMRLFHPQYSSLSTLTSSTTQSSTPDDSVYQTLEATQWRLHDHADHNHEKIAVEVEIMPAQNSNEPIIQITHPHQSDRLH